MQVRRAVLRHPPVAVQCRCDGNMVYALIGSIVGALTGDSGIDGVIGFGPTLPDALRELADAIEEEVTPRMRGPFE